MTNVYDLEGKVSGKVDLPKVFTVEPRPDLWKRVILAIRSHLRQAYGHDPLAGLRSSAHYHGNRHYRYTMMNREMSRIPRQHGHTSQPWRARKAPHAVSGRRAHGPKVNKNWDQKVNSKENKLAVKSAIAATGSKELLSQRHPTTEKLNDLPLVITNEFEKLNKTKDVEKVFEKLGLSAELERCKEVKIRGSKGKSRGRRYITKPGVLIVVSEDNGIVKAATNLPGVDVVNVKNLNVQSLAPGMIPRLTIWSENAIKQLK